MWDNFRDELNVQRSCILYAARLILGTFMYATEHRKHEMCVSFFSLPCLLADGSSIETGWLACCA